MPKTYRIEKLAVLHCCVEVSPSIPGAANSSIEVVFTFLTQQPRVQILAGTLYFMTIKNIEPKILLRENGT